MISPIALFGFNRPDHIRRTLRALAENDLAEESVLYCFVDGPRGAYDETSVLEVRRVVLEKYCFREVIPCFSETNLGLAKSVIGGVGRLMSEYGRAIVVEDDIITAPGFLRYMNDALDRYAERRDIFSVSGFCHPPRVFKLPKNYRQDVFLSLRNSTWGWASWQDRWEAVDWQVTGYERFSKDEAAILEFAKGGRDLPGMLELQMNGKIDSWGIRFSYAHYLNRAMAVYPVRSFVDNIGNDGTGIHCNRDDRMKNDLRRASSNLALPLELQASQDVLEAFRQVYEPTNWMQTKRFIKSILRRMK